jgi:alpha-beta hydrolase superfamily lysophospholipase
MLGARAKEFPVPIYALHGKEDVRTSCEAIEEFVDRVGPTEAFMDVIQTDGHQLLRDKPEVVQDIMGRIKNWILQTTNELK